MLRNLFLGLLLFLAPCACADSVTNLSGVIHEPGVKFTYSFSVRTIDEPLFVVDILNGTLDSHGSGRPTHTIFIDDVYEFGYNESVLMWSFGSHPTWNLVATANGVSLVDPPGVATPEPATLALVLLGLACFKAYNRTHNFKR